MSKSCQMLRADRYHVVKRPGVGVKSPFDGCPDQRLVPFKYPEDPASVSLARLDRCPGWLLAQILAHKHAIPSPGWRSARPADDGVTKTTCPPGISAAFGARFCWPLGGHFQYPLLAGECGTESLGRGRHARRQLVPRQLDMVHMLAVGRAELHVIPPGRFNGRAGVSIPCFFHYWLCSGAHAAAATSRLTSANARAGVFVFNRSGFRFCFNAPRSPF